jgi:hypothetical protein
MAMSFGPNTIQALFAILAGILTIAKGEAWIGPMFPPTFILKGAVSYVIGLVAIGLGLFLLLTN